MKRILRSVANVLGLAGSHGTRPPSLPLDHFDFVEAPHIVRRGDEYFLRYQVATGGRMVQVHPVFARRTEHKAYYFFRGSVSATESGQPRELPLGRDHFAEHAQRDAVYWLDPDGTETHLQITDEPSPPPSEERGPRNRR